MTNFVRTTGFVGMLVLALVTLTPEVKAASLNNSVREGTAVVTKLSFNASAITYWVGEEEGWRVVTTVDTVIGQDGDDVKHAVVRFSSVLRPGESQVISVPYPIGEQQQVLRNRRLGDEIEIARVPDSG